MNVSQGMVSRWENGDCNFTLSTLCYICDKLSLILDIQIMKEEDYRSADVSKNWDNIEPSVYVFQESCADKAMENIAA